MSYIYLIHCRASVNCNEPVYKIGQTINFIKRVSQYDKGSVPIFMLYVKDCTAFETHLKKIFESTFKKRIDYGSEYFEGDLNQMISIITEEFTKNILEQSYTSTNSTIIKQIDIRLTEDEDDKYFIYNKAGIWANMFQGWGNHDGINLSPKAKKENIVLIKKMLNNTQLDIEYEEQIKKYYKNSGQKYAYTINKLYPLWNLKEREKDTLHSN
jgi:hypothetical protein